MLRAQPDNPIEWYQDIYSNPDYKMGLSRMKSATRALSKTTPGTLLDVGCGRGEILGIAQNMGFVVTGLEASAPMADGVRVVRGTAQSLPFTDAAFDVVTMFDVIEHIPAIDVNTVFSELNRVARQSIIITASNRPSVYDGVDLHITKYEYTEWDTMLNAFFSDCLVTWEHGLSNSISELWRIQK